MEMSEQASEGELVKYLKVRMAFIPNTTHPVFHAPSNTTLLSALTFNAAIDFHSIYMCVSLLTSRRPSLHQSLHAMEGHVMVNFLPTILNQLFCVLTRATHEDVAVNVTRQVTCTQNIT